MSLNMVLCEVAGHHINSVEQNSRKLNVAVSTAGTGISDLVTVDAMIH